MSRFHDDSAGGEDERAASSFRRRFFNFLASFFSPAAAAVPLAGVPKKSNSVGSVDPLAFGASNEDMSLANRFLSNLEPPVSVRKASISSLSSSEELRVWAKTKSEFSSFRILHLFEF